MAQTRVPKETRRCVRVVAQCPLLAPRNQLGGCWPFASQGGGERIIHGTRHRPSYRKTLAISGEISSAGMRVATDLFRQQAYSVRGGLGRNRPAAAHSSFNAS